MSHMPARIAFNKRSAIVALALMLWLVALTAFGQVQQSIEVRELTPNQTLQREMTGAETHRYKFDLNKDEFFHVRVEQKSVDVALKLLDASGAALATMGSPRWERGQETLSFVAKQAGNFMLEVKGLDANAGKGNYTIHREAPRKATAKDKRRVIVERLFAEGMAARDMEGLEETAIKKLSEALAGWRELADGYMTKLTARLLAGIVYAEGMKAGDKGEFRIALGRFKEAISLFREVGSKTDEAKSLSYAGFLSDSDVLGNKAEALRFFEQAITIFRELKDKDGEAETLNRIGLGYFNSGENRKALGYFNQALPLFSETGNKIDVATTLQYIGDTHRKLGENQKALNYFRQGFSLFRELNNKSGQALVLTSIGRVYEASGEPQKTLEYYDRALRIYKEQGDKGGEAAMFTFIAGVYNHLGENQKALAFYQQGLAHFKEAGDKINESTTLNNIGLVYADLGEKRKALDFYQQALSLRRGSGDEENEKWDEIATLNNIGSIHADLGEYQKALETFNRASSLSRDINNKSREALALVNIGSVLSMTGKRAKALETLTQALALYRETGYRYYEATTLLIIGAVYQDSGAHQKALDYYHQALSLYKLIGSKPGEADVLDYLMLVWESLGNRSIAAFYGKQSVNKFQELRQAIQSLDKETQRTYRKQVEPTYRRLTDILIAEGRLLEAEQVLAMLKEEEVFDYLRRDASETDNLQQRADLRPEEREALKRYNEIADKITTLGAEFGTLQELQSKGVKLSVEQERRYTELSTQIEAASRSFQVFLRQLAEEFAKRTNTEKDLQENLALKSDLKSWGEGLVFLYTLAGEDRYRVILVTPDTQVDGKTEIKAAELNRKIEKFRSAVQDPTVDPRPLGKELYDILIKPVEKHLDGAKAKTLLWSLDGNLRLLPLAALWDGKQYFGQKYQNVTVTLASRTRLGDAVTLNWHALGLGVSEARKVKEPNGTRELTFRSLPAVRAELRSIVQSEQSPNGVLPGQSLLDADFNENALESQLLRGYKVIHIASHFSLNPGDATRSFLLLGDGNVLTVDNMKNNPKLSFRGVELLTLSACQTAVVEKDSSGKEIEGFGYVAQQKGAKAILATLWSVADESTQLLMSEFYRLRKENPQLTKAAALQMAQQEMIAGKLKPAQIKGERRDTSEANADPTTDYSHPYYWSPFILIGNWR